MDTITQAITGALSRLNEKNQENVNQLYSTLKEDIQKRYDGDLSKALAELEQTPDSADHLEDLADELIRSGARKDKALLALARTLLDSLNPADDKASMGQSGTALASDAMMTGLYDNNEDEDEELIIG